MSFEQPVIVYVEDDQASIVVMKAIVEKIMKLPALHVLPNAADFVERIGQLRAKPDIFLFDIHMSPLNGFDLLALLRADPQYRDSKAVALTASVMSEEVARLKQSGFDGAIAKPLNIEVFPDLIARILAGEKVWYIV
jgi:CheY-like chemotaxis protein